LAQPSDFNENFRSSYPKVWNAFSELSDSCHEGGALDDKNRRLVKLAIAVAAGLEGGTHSAVRHAKDAGITRQEMEHVAVLAITTIGFPAAMRALSWIRDTE
jgi:4-carboxymuconolactone decarboxylase